MNYNGVYFGIAVVKCYKSLELECLGKHKRACALFSHQGSDPWVEHLPASHILSPIQLVEAIFEFQIEINKDI